MRPLAPFAAATTLALLSAACTAPSPGPVVAAPPPLALPSPTPVAMPSPPPTSPATPAPPAPTRLRNARPSRAPTLDEIATHASGIYLARVERANGLVHHIVTEIWRADPGASVAVGDDVQTSPERQPSPTTPDTVIVYVFSPHLVRADGTRVSQGAASVFDGRVPAYRLTLAETRDRLR